MRALALFGVRHLPRLVALVMGLIAARFWWLGEAEAFQRFGSLCVLAGLALAMLLPNRFDHIERGIDEVFGPDDPSPDDLSALKRAYGRIEERERYRFSHRRAEIFLVLSGTLIWGYGDLLVTATSPALP